MLPVHIVRISTDLNGLIVLTNTREGHVRCHIEYVFIDLSALLLLCMFLLDLGKELATYVVVLETFKFELIW